MHRNNTHNLIVRKTLKEKQLNECVFCHKTSRGTLDRQTVKKNGEKKTVTYCSICVCVCVCVL